MEHIASIIKQLGKPLAGNNEFIIYLNSKDWVTIRANGSPFRKADLKSFKVLSWSFNGYDWLSYVPDYHIDDLKKVYIEMLESHLSKFEVTQCPDMD